MGGGLFYLVGWGGGSVDEWAGTPRITSVGLKTHFNSLGYVHIYVCNMPWGYNV